MKHSLLCCLLLLIASCTFQRTAVNNLERVISFRLGHQLGLYFGQKSQLTQELQDWLLHPKIKAEIELSQTFLKEFDWQKSDLKQSADFLFQTYRRLALSFNCVLAKQLGLLDSSQQQKFFQRMENENKKISKEQSQRKSMERSLIFFFKEITPQQLSLLNQLYPENDVVPSTRLARRLRSQEQIKGLYQQNLPTNELSLALQEVLDEAVKHPTDQQQIDKNLAFFEQLRPTLTQEQLAYFEAKKLQALEILGLLKQR